MPPENVHELIYSKGVTNLLASLAAREPVSVN